MKKMIPLMIFIIKLIYKLSINYLLLMKKMIPLMIFIIKLIYKLKFQQNLYFNKNIFKVKKLKKK